MNMVLRWVQNGLHGDRIARTPIDKQPVFVIGHWRTGTTLLARTADPGPAVQLPGLLRVLQPEPLAL